MGEQTNNCKHINKQINEEPKWLHLLVRLNEALQCERACEWMPWA